MWERSGGEFASVRFLHYHHAWVLAEFPRELAVADVDGVNFRCAVLEEAIGETARGGAKIDGGEIRDAELKVVQRVFKFVSPPADEFVGRIERKLITLSHGVACLVRALTVYFDSPGKDGAFRLFPAFAKAAIDECLVEANLHFLFERRA